MIGNRLTPASEIPEDMLVNEPMEVIVEGHVVGGGGSYG